MATDTFTDTNGTILDTHDAKWNMGQANAFVIQSNRCQLNGPGGEQAWYQDGQGQVQASECSWAPGIYNDGCNRIAFCNGTGGWGGGYAMKLEHNGSTNLVFTLLKDASWQSYYQADSGVTPAAAASGGIIIKIAQLSGGTIKLYVNGSEVGSWADGTPKTGGYPGFSVTRDTGTSADYAIDSWTDAAAAAGNAGGKLAGSRDPVGGLVNGGLVARPRSGVLIPRRRDIIVPSIHAAIMRGNFRSEARL
jgi:hypothetical protein